MCVAVFYGWAVTCEERFRAHPTLVVHECICGDQAQGNASACRAKARTTFSRPSIVACAETRPRHCPGAGCANWFTSAGRQPCNRMTPSHGQRPS
ncbi:hypothetical protein GCM10009566_40280 [Streptomyces murinus]